MSANLRRCLMKVEDGQVLIDRCDLADEVVLTVSWKIRVFLFKIPTNSFIFKEENPSTPFR